MAAAYGDAPAAGARAAELRALALELAQRDAGAYVPVLEALRLPAADPARAARLEAALSAAAECPLAIARAAAEVAELAVAAHGATSRHVRGDAAAGAILADAACAAAARLAEINLAGRPDDPRRAEAAKLARRAADARRTVG
jgi:formiminotetrahydrofolate cyclodeaminase